MKNANYLDHRLQNQNITSAISNSIETSFPVESNGRKLIIENVIIKDTLLDMDFPKQKKTKLDRKTWQVPIYADIKLIDSSSGKIISQKKNSKIGHIPKLTNRFTTIIDGNEYQTTNQLRRKSGIYARVKNNGELENEFNLERGYNFKMQLDPIKQIFVVILKNRKYRLWTLLNLLGVSDRDMEKAWGSELLLLNKKGALNTEVSEMTSIYKNFYKKDPKDYNEVISGLNEYFNNYTKVSKETTKVTLGTGYENVDGKTLLASSVKLLNINKGTDIPDKRDSLIFKNIYGIDDLLSAHFEKHSESLQKKMIRSMSLKDNVRDIVSASAFTKPIKEFFTVGDLSATPPQTNPASILSDWRKTTPMGTGGIGSSHAITMDARSVQPSHLGFLDPLATPESGKIGVSVGLTSEVHKTGNDITSPVIDKKGKIHYLNPTQFFSKVVGFPDQYKTVNGLPKSRGSNVTVMHEGETKRVASTEVDYYLRSPKSMFSFESNMVPFLETVQGNRGSMGGRMITQALALDQKEAPYVQVKRDDDKTYEQLVGNFLNPAILKGEGGTIEKITDDYVTIKKPDGESFVKGLYNNFPLNQDGFLHSDVIVQVGDKVKKGDSLADSNYSSGGALSIGKNLTVAYMPWKGYNFEDGAVITESAAEKLSHTMIHKKNVYFNPKISIFDKKKFAAWYPEEISPDNLAKLGSDGIAKKGKEFFPGEVVAAFLVEKVLDDQERALKKLNKAIFSMYTKVVVEWDEDESGTVIDIKKVGRNLDIYIKSVHPFKLADKLSGRYGNKNIVTKIIPDSEAPHRPDGTPVDIMVNPHGVPGRMNIGQLLEAGAGKIAKKTGNTYIVDNFDDPDDDSSKKVLADMKKAGIKPNEVLTDGKGGKAFKNPIFVGEKYFMKLRHIVKKKSAGHGIGSYDVDNRPVGKGAQKVGHMETYAYLAHGAKNNLYEIANIKGRENEEYWRALQLGLAPPKPSRNFVFDKMLNRLNAAGVNTEKVGDTIKIFPLTDKDVKKLSNGELKDPGALLIGKNLASRKGGLFDNDITGGSSGKNWSHIKLVDRIPNPMYQDSIQKILGITENKFNAVMDGSEKLDPSFKKAEGVNSILSALKNLDVNKELTSSKRMLKKAPPSDVNKLNKKVRFLQTLKKLKLNAYDAYTMQYLPVLPPIFRPIYPLPSGDLMVNDLNHHYRDVGLINQGYKKAKVANVLTKEDGIKYSNNLYSSVKALQGFIDPVTYGNKKYKGILKDLSGQSLKRGYVHGTMWDSRQDLSGRSTITVEPSLGIDQVGVPTKMAYKIFQPFIIKDLKQQGMSASSALKAYNDEDILAKNSLNNVVKSRPVIINRAPSLHKHSIQAFNTVLTDGSDIKLNPVVVKGFNADFDGDTMSVNIPIGNDAVEEAYRMLPSKNIFKHGDLSVVPDLGQDYQLGLYQVSILGKNTGKSFKTIAEAKAAKLDMTDVFKLGKQSMTLGQYYINKVLPDPLKNYSRVLDVKTVGDVLTRVGKDYRDKFPTVMNAWKDLSVQYGHIVGNTVSITDFTIDRSYRDNIYKNALPKIQKMTEDKRIDALLKLTSDIEKAQDKNLFASNNLYRMYESGSFSKKDSIRQVLSMPGVLQDVSGKALPIPVLKSYGEGIDTPSYFNSMYAVRKGTIDRAVNTQDSGALNKTLLSVNRNLLITEEDCGTLKDIEMEVNSKDVMDRVLGESISGVARRNDLIDSSVILKLKSAGVQSIKVRSPLTCESVEGVCSFCYGLLPNGKLPSVGISVGILESQALTERSTQLVMKTFHSGGSASAGGGLTDRFPRLEELLKVPEKLVSKATLSDVKGKVKWIEKNPIGGYDIRVEGYGTQNDKTFTVPSGRIPSVKIGDLVNVGDRISDGTIKPQELSDLKSHLEAQQYIVSELNGPVFEDKFFKKTFETIVRGVSDNAYITKAPTGSGFLRGDKTSISRIERLNKERKMSGLDLVGYRPYFKSVDTLNSDSEDWLTKFTTNRIKAALVEGASAGQVTDIHGKDPIPAYVYGEEFARNEGEHY